MKGSEELLREFVGLLFREEARLRFMGGSDPNEAFDKSVKSDKAYRRRSTYVPNEDKDEIGDWLDDMGLSTTWKKRARSG